jgi:hypothetical protein
LQDFGETGFSGVGTWDGPGAGRNQAPLSGSRPAIQIVR